MEGMPLTCLPQASCINNYGSYMCRCPEGYEGDGLYSCLDRDECATGAYYCNAKTICVNTLGSYICVCQSGLIGIGNHCRERSVWTPWSPWSICTVQCGHQNQMRIRLCTHPESGMRCQGPSVELRPCPVKTSCPVDGAWSEWSPWSICSYKCSGLKKRIRLCNSPAPVKGGLLCPGPNEEVAICKSATCPVDGMWSSWTAWTPCPLSCGLAVVSRSRQCDSPSPEHGGKICSGTDYEEGSCGFPEEFCKYLNPALGRFVPGKLIH
ncbi:thrombospondin-1 [Microcaecilia unicolor]|uniref:Thrombospondin-1-like n=1 Tax=Microcaecilia unicolor TaxID=1415580 RepID=A0A6P7WL31_9AMPH|nr:thrombospondin-1-like [Microcaecilia unicolor]